MKGTELKLLVVVCLEGGLTSRSHELARCVFYLL